MTRTLLIGMDGATFTVLDALTSSTDGREPVMPFLARIYRGGARSKLRSTINPLTPPAWVSLMTGRSPGEHGILDFIRAEERGEDVFFTLFDSRDCLVEMIWTLAANQGKRTVALNFPFTAPPPKDFDGFMVPGFVPWRHLRRNTVPSDLYDRLVALPDFNPKELAWDFNQEKQAMEALSDEDRENWVRYHLPREQQWNRIAQYLLAEEAPDLMAVMFDGVDKLQHQAWQFIDPRIEANPKDDYHRRMRSLCQDYFRQLDGFIEGLVTRAGDDVRVFLASDHGFTGTTEIVRINSFLAEKGHLRWKPDPTDSAEAARREDSMFANLDWDGTTAYCGTPSSNGIVIRVAREPGQRGVSPEEYEDYRDRLIAELADLRDPKTGECIIREIHKREDVYAGPAMENAPDLLMVLRDFGFVSIKNKTPVVEPRDEVAGTHHPDGVFLAFGKGIKRGAMVAPHNIVDVGATLLYSLGLDVPSDFEGRVAEAVFTPEHLARHPVVIGAPTTGQMADEDANEMSEQEEEQIKAQLRMLGYL
jgi:predicted AlkP superfamily phosphohydrolase/phosphomutase